MNLRLPQIIRSAEFSRWLKHDASCKQLVQIKDRKEVVFHQKKLNGTAPPVVLEKLLPLVMLAVEQNQDIIYGIGYKNGYYFTLGPVNQLPDRYR